MGAKPVIILGMHRSGTSCLAGSLEQAGLFLGPVNTKAPHNAKGNRENLGIMDLNDAVLSNAGRSWNNPPATPVAWSAKQLALRDALIATYPTDKTWAFKEPRTLFTLECWLEALPTARLVGSFRHPLAVAQSLHTRDGFSIERGMNLWLAYNRKLLQFCQNRDVSLVCFDWTPQHYDHALIALSVRLGLTLPETGFNFFETRLRHTCAPLHVDLPQLVQATYQALLDRVVADPALGDL